MWLCSAVLLVVIAYLIVIGYIYIQYKLGFILGTINKISNKVSVFLLKGLEKATWLASRLHSVLVATLLGP